jgi:diguanylate cyclase
VGRDGDAVVAWLAFVALGAGIGLYAGALDGLRPRAFHAVIAMMQVVITLAYVAPNDAGNDLRLFLIWTTPVAAFFFRPLAAALHAGFASALLAAALVIHNVSFAEATRLWLMTTGTLVALTWIVAWAAVGVRRRDAAMSYAATHDPLTSLPNRALFAARTAEALAARRHDGGQVFIMLADLDRFKMVNDTHGHHAGDEMLTLLAPRLTEHTPANAMVARLGGDEFAFLIQDPTGELDPLAVAADISAAWKEPLMLERGLIHTSACLGVAVASDGDMPSSLLRNADSAMYKAKSAGPGSMRLYDEEQRAELARRLELEQALYDALPEQQFSLFYHPVVNLASGRVQGAEALIRWDHPELGLVHPGEFIALAEEAGLIDAIGLWVLNQALGQLREWRDDGVVDSEFQIAVNVSGAQLHGHFPRHVGKLLATHGIQARSLLLELTETVLMVADAEASDVLRDLERIEVPLAIDDFGTGYSSLSYLHQATVNTVKIAQSFVSGMSTDHTRRAIVEAVVALAGALGLSVIAEGVDTFEQVELLRSMGCERGQGFLFTRPMPPEGMRAFLGIDPVDLIRKPVHHRDG